MSDIYKKLAENYLGLNTSFENSFPKEPRDLTFVEDVYFPDEIEMDDEQLMLQEFLKHDPLNQANNPQFLNKDVTTDLFDSGWASGTRVVFVPNLETLLMYADPPPHYGEGSVVMVRSANSNSTMRHGFVYVKWDDGKLRSIRPEHLEKLSSQDKSVKIITSRSKIALSFDVAHQNELVHKATKELWSFQKTSDGKFSLERLFDENGEPVKQ